ncbi:MAG TPA: VWA domain-containing protein [Acidimicrobiia bacterium]|nr:VWA domain-containing protein [Acidimicrobiia bacterium]
MGFARVLRGAGLDVPVGTTVLFAEALGAVGVSTRDSVYWAGRTTLLSRPEDIELYDRCFAAWWERVFQLGSAPVEEREVILAFDADGDDDAPEDDSSEPRDAPTLAVRFSRAEVLRQRDFAHYSPDEFAESRRLMDDLRMSGATRRSRRMRASRHDRGRPDLRRTVRRALRTAGEPISRAYVEPSERPRRLVLLCDVSGSMEAYARGLVRFLHAAVVGRGRVEAFAVGTRLTRITRELSSRDPDAAIAAAARRVTDWSGGTRLGEGLRQFNDEWGIRGMARGAVVVILSDGWDRGDPELLGEQMERLHRVAHQVVWVNPLKSSPNFAPLARGMAAALPHVDEFVEGHNLASLEQLARIVSGEKVTR